MSMVARVVLLALILGDAASAEEIFTSDQERTLDGFVSDLMQCSRLPALSLTVVKDDKVFTKAYGLDNLETREPSTPDSLFCIASVTKAFTATLLSKLLPDKYPKTAWDTKVKDILGSSFRLVNKDITEQVTVRDILSHRTGLSGVNLGWFGGYADSVTRDDLVRKLRYLPAEHPFRYVYQYNNWMYMLAGHVAEVLAGDGSSYEDLMDSHIFRPLGMNSTVFNKGLQKLIDTRQVALPYIYRDGNYTNVDYGTTSVSIMAPTGGICSTGRDMTSWLQFLLQTPGAPSLSDVVNPTAFAQTMAPTQVNNYYLGNALTVPTFPVDLNQPAYALGWFVGSYRGRHLVQHGGYLFAYTSLLWLFPESKIGIFVNSNGYLEATSQVKEVLLGFISDLLMGETPWVNSTTACSFPLPWKQPFTIPTFPIPRERAQRPLKDYTGVYGNRLIGDITITVGSSNNTLALKMGMWQSVLYPTENKDEFFMKMIGAYDFFPQGAKNSFVFKNGKAQILSYGAFEFHRNVRFSDKDDENEAKPPIGGSPQQWPSVLVILLSLALFISG